MNILTTEQVKKELFLDGDFPLDTLSSYAEDASSFVLQKTGYDFAAESSIHPLAKRLAKLYVREMHFNNAGEYNKEHDYSIGISSLICDLQDIAKSKIAAKAVDDLISLIPSVELITLENETLIDNARAGYGALYSVDIKYVTKYDTLIAAEAKLESLR